VVFDSLLEAVPGGASGLEVVALVEDLAEVVDLSLFGGGAQDEVVGGEGGLGHQGFHGRLNLPEPRLLFREFGNHQCLRDLANFRKIALGRIMMRLPVILGVKQGMV